MLAYIVRRTLYAIPILIGVNLLTFWLFFVVNSPEDMARMQLGMKRVTPEAIEKWKQDHGYDKPLLLNTQASGSAVFSNTIFFTKSVRLFVFDFGNADDGRNIAHDIRQRMMPSLALAIPVFIIGLLELLGIARSVINQADYIGRQRETLVFISIIYFVLSYLMSWMSRRLEHTGAGAVRRA